MVVRKRASQFETMQEVRARQAVAERVYVHRSALEALDPLLRVYEGCAALTWAKPTGPTRSS